MRREVESLLAESASDDGFLAEPPLADVGAGRSPTSASRPDRSHRSAATSCKALLGAGGMGEVYRAHDPKLGRDVAIKILPAAFTSDPDRLARFEREARMLASLNHPNICAIYGFEEADGIRFLILELVEGDTLADTIARVGSADETRRAAARAGAGHRAADRRRARSRARQGHRPPRPEAREHQDHAGRRREGARLRPREGRRAATGRRRT